MRRAPRGGASSGAGVVGLGTGRGGSDEGGSAEGGEGPTTTTPECDASATHRPAAHSATQARATTLGRGLRLECRRRLAAGESGRRGARLGRQAGPRDDAGGGGGHGCASPSRPRCSST